MTIAPRWMYTTMGGANSRRQPLAGSEASRDHELVELFFASAPGALFLYDVRGHLVRWNRNIRAVTGLTDAELSRLSPLDLFRGDDVQRVAAAIDATMQVGEGAVEATLVSKDGQAVPYFLTARRVMFDGHPCLLGIGIDISDRVLAEENLRRSEQRYHSTLDSIVEGAQLVGFDWRYVYLNDAAAVQNRRPNVELLGRTMPECWPGLEASPIFAMLRRCMDERVALHGEFPFTFPDGSTGTYDIHAQPVPEGIFIRSIDVTERHRAVAHAAEMRRRFEMVVEHLAEGLVIATPDLSLLHWNPAALRLLGFDRVEEGRTHQRMFEQLFEIFTLDGQRLPVDQWPLARARRGEAFQDLELRARRRGSDWDRIISYSGSRVAYGDQGLLAFMTLRDVTERHLARQALEESEERFRQLAETISQVFWIADADSLRILYVSPAYEAIWGRTRESLYADGDSWQDAIHLDDRAAVRVALSGQLRDDYDITYRIIRPDGAMRWVHDRAFPVRDASGSVYRIVGIAEDITERKSIEARSLRSQRLESIGTMAGGIAHDLNNVLTPILMSIELLRADTAGAQSLENLAVIEMSARRGADMLKQVLSFARGVDGRRDTVDVASVVRDVEKIVNDTFLKAIGVLTILPPSLPPIVGDSTQLHQVLLNLCVNARDAMPHGGTITIEARARDLSPDERAAHPAARPGPGVEITVRDTGVGMTSDVLERAFEPFFTTKELGKGTGLGLSTSMAIVTSHGGCISVDSAPDDGCTFTIWIPAAAARQPASRGVDAAATLPAGRGETLLVVDDEQAIRHVMQRTLESFGYRVVLASNGAEALAAFVDHRDAIAAVITDMMMPVMDGKVLIASLRRMSETLPIIAASGLLDGAFGRDDPHTIHLAKPYALAALLQALQQVMRASPA